MISASSEPESAFSLWLLFFGLFSAQNNRFSCNFLEISPNLPETSGNHSFSNVSQPDVRETTVSRTFPDFPSQNLGKVSPVNSGETFGELDPGNRKAVLKGNRKKALLF